MNKILTLSLAMAITIPQAHAEPSNANKFRSISPTKFEKVPPGEDGQIGKIISLTTQLLQQRYGDSMARRAVHPKDHGCVQAAFTVNPDIPDKYRVGVLAAPGKKYDAWIRFSNATGTVTPDIEEDGNPSRGMAIKLMGVEGATLLGEPGAKTQDFLLINQPMFAFPNVSEYLALNTILLNNNDKAAKFFAPPLSDERKKTLGIIQGIKKTPLGNPLDSPYFSASPFLFGKDTVAKFSVKPRDPAVPSVPPPNPSPNYLREAMKKSLDTNTGKPAVFDFQVQIRTSDALPIEDASAEWMEKDAPFQNVAVINIDKQDFDNPLRSTECEHLVLTPWHGLVEHQPLGGINRLRLGVYIASSQYRAQTREPSGFPKSPAAN